MTFPRSGTNASANASTSALPIQFTGTSLLDDVGAAACVLILLHQDSNLGQPRPAPPAKRQREGTGPETRPAVKWRHAIDLTSDSASSSSQQPEPMRRELPPPASAAPVPAVPDTPLLQTLRYAHSFPAAPAFDLVLHIKTRGVNAAMIEGEFKGWSALHIAAFKGDLNMLRVLRRATQFIVNGYVAHDAPQLAGATPVEAAIRGRQTDAVRFLANLGADVGTLRTQGVHRGLSPLHLAVLVGHLPTVQALLRTWMTNPHETSLHPELLGRSAVDIAQTMNQESILQELSAYDSLMEQNPIFSRGASLLAQHAHKLT